MHNAAVVARMRIPQTDRFETTIPKEHFFNSPRTKQAPKQLPVFLGYLLAGAIIGGFVMAIPKLHQESTPVVTKEIVAPTPPPLPEVSAPVVARAMPVPVPSTPRAQLLHIRAIGTFENDRMPDGRIVGTIYRGELPSAANLPRHGQIGDMWFTRADGHVWVLAPIAVGSQITGWVDP
jgi:hypothetical protein